MEGESVTWYSTGRFSPSAQMPMSEEYATGFALEYDLVFAGYQLLDWEIGHQQLVLFNEYAYPTVLTFYGYGDPAELLAAIQEYTAGLRVIDSKSGRPYKCLFQWPDEGYAKRIGRQEAASKELGGGTEFSFSNARKSTN
jgi:hypothetical protein